LANRVTSEGQLGLLPESCVESFAALGALELGAGKSASSLLKKRRFGELFAFAFESGWQFER
jgi:hypothetical protein